MATVSIRTLVPNCLAGYDSFVSLGSYNTASNAAVPTSDGSFTYSTVRYLCNGPSGSQWRSGYPFKVETVTFDTGGGMTDAQYQGLVAAINGTTSAVNTKGDLINTSVGGTTTAINTTSTNEVAKVDSAMNYGVVGLAALLFVVGFAMGYRITFRRGGL